MTSTDDNEHSYEQAWSPKHEKVALWIRIPGYILAFGLIIHGLLEVIRSV